MLVEMGIYTFFRRRGRKPRSRTKSRSVSSRINLNTLAEQRIQQYFSTNRPKPVTKTDLDLFIRRDSQDMPLIFKYARSGGQYHKLLAALIEAGLKVNIRAPDGSTLLHHAAQCGSSKDVRVLLTKIGPNVKDNKGRTPAMWTALRRCPYPDFLKRPESEQDRGPVLRALASAGADLSGVAKLYANRGMKTAANEIANMQFPNRPRRTRSAPARVSAVSGTTLANTRLQFQKREKQRNNERAQHIANVRHIQNRPVAPWENAKYSFEPSKSARSEPVPSSRKSAQSSRKTRSAPANALKKFSSFETYIQGLLTKNSLTNAEKRDLKLYIIDELRKHGPSEENMAEMDRLFAAINAVPLSKS